MKCVVTGGAGFIGSHLVDGLIRQGHEVTIVDDLSEGKRENLAGPGDKAKLIVASILQKSVLDAVFDGAEIVFHEAALRSVPNSLERPLDYHRVNVDGTYTVLECARKNDVKRVVFASSSSVYGEKHPLPLKETYIPGPKSPYGLTKIAGEHYMGMYHELYGIKTISLRYFNVFGPRQDPNSPYSAVIPLFMKAISTGQSPTICGDGEQTRDFTYVENVVQANLLAASASSGFGGAFNVAQGATISVNALAEKIALLLGKKISPVHEEPRAGDVRHTRASLEQAKKILKYSPAVTLDEGLARTLRWFQECWTAAASPKAAGGLKRGKPAISP